MINRTPSVGIAQYNFEEGATPLATIDNKTKKYVCTNTKCNLAFERWKQAKLHMTKDCKIVKPNLKLSQQQADELYPKPPVELSDPFKGKLKTEKPPTEEELIVDVLNFYKKSDKNHKKYVLTFAIRPKYGAFEFNCFGFGTFAEFSDKHGLSVYKPIDRKYT